MFWGMMAVVLALIADQWSKYWAFSGLSAEHPLVLTDWFNLVKVFNSGVSFSMFSNHGLTGAILLSAAAVAISAVLLFWMYKEGNVYKRICLGLVIGGALGNVIDRIRFGAVLDFLDFHYQASHWPAFNLADTFICVGTFLLIVMELANTRLKGENKI